MQLILTTILPIFAIVALGAFTEKLGLMAKNTKEVLTDFVFRFSLPILLFGGIASHPLHDLININFLIGQTIALTLLLIIYYFILSKAFKNTSSIAAIKAATMTIPNSTIIGLPVAFTILGLRSIIPIAITIIPFIAAVTICIVILEINTNSTIMSSKAIVKKITVSIIKNPLIFLPIIGVTYTSLKIPLPNSITIFCKLIGYAASPCALFAIGQSLIGNSIKDSLKNIITLNIFKLIIQPIILFLVFLVFKVSPFWEVAGLILVMSPTGVVVFVLAGEYKVIEKQIAATIASGIIFSIISLSILLLLIPHLWPTLHLHNAFL